MALAKSHTVSLLGLNGTAIEVEADISSNLPNFVLVGLPDASLSEATIRVRAACANSGFQLPSRKVVVNLSPAAVPKSGSSFDLAIAIAVISAMGAVEQSSLDGVAIFGELGLDGSIRAIPGVLPMVMAAREAGFSSAVIPAGNLREALLVTGMRFIAAQSLSQTVGALVSGTFESDALPEASDQLVASETQLDLEQLLGQEQAVEGLIVAAAGGHHLAMVGAPGAGKTMLAERMTSILPPLTVQQALEVAAIESIVSDGQAQVGLNQHPRFIAPHHTASTAALLGGGTGLPRPGAVSRAHHGILFLDEALEFHSGALDALREPLESGRVTINRSAGSAIFPARFQLLLAANPCPCGMLGVPNKQCTCNVPAIRRYANRLSGPILDRIDIRLSVRPVSLATSAGLTKPFTSSKKAAIAVKQARQTAVERYSNRPHQLNALLSAQDLRRRFKPPAVALRELDRLLGLGKTSMRGYDRCLRLSWTIADLEGHTTPTREDILRAISLRGSEQLVGA